MNNPFKPEEKKPYTYSSIEMRKSSRKSFWWIVGFLLLITSLFAILHSL